MIIAAEIYLWFTVVSCILFAFYHFVAKAYLIDILDFLHEENIEEFQAYLSKNPKLPQESLVFVMEELLKTQSFLGKITYGDIWQLRRAVGYSDETRAHIKQREAVESSLPKEAYTFLEKSAFIGLSGMVVMSPLASPSLFLRLLPALVVWSIAKRAQNPTLPHESVVKHETLVKKVEAYEQNAYEQSHAICH